MGDKSVIGSPDQLARVLRSRRNACGLTQHAAGANVGLLPKTISALESDPAGSTVASLFKLVSALDLEFVLQPRPRAAPPGSTGPAW